MMKIANTLNRTYIDEYIKLRPKGNVIFADGSVVDTSLAQDDKYISNYIASLESQSKKIIKTLNK